MHHFDLSSLTALSSLIFATDFLAASHCEAATSVRKSGARTDTRPHRNLRANRCRSVSFSPGMFRCNTVHSAVTRTATQLQMMSSVPRVSGPWTQPLKSSDRMDVLVLLPNILAAKAADGQTKLFARKCSELVKEAVWRRSCILAIVIVHARSDR